LVPRVSWTRFVCVVHGMVAMVEEGPHLRCVCGERLRYSKCVVVGSPCSPASDCTGNQHYSARFHPGGDALNVLVNMLVERFEAERGWRRRIL